MYVPYVHVSGLLLDLEDSAEFRGGGRDVRYGGTYVSSPGGGR